MLTQPLVHSRKGLQRVLELHLVDPASASPSQCTVAMMYSLRLKKECRFFLSDILFDNPSYSIFFINIIYFVMTYFIIIDTIIMIYLFYNLPKKINKTNGQT
jgi:hypothetical protein